MGNHHPKPVETRETLPYAEESAAPATENIPERSLSSTPSPESAVGSLEGGDNVPARNVHHPFIEIDAKNETFSSVSNKPNGDLDLSDSQYSDSHNAHMVAIMSRASIEANLTNAASSMEHYRNWQNFVDCHTEVLATRIKAEEIRKDTEEQRTTFREALDLLRSVLKHPSANLAANGQDKRVLEHVEEVIRVQDLLKSADDRLHQVEQELVQQEFKWKTALPAILRSDVDSEVALSDARKRNPEISEDTAFVAVSSILDADTLQGTSTQDDRDVILQRLDAIEHLEEDILTTRASKATLKRRLLLEIQEGSEDFASALDELDAFEKQEQTLLQQLTGAIAYLDVLRGSAQMLQDASHVQGDRIDHHYDSSLPAEASDGDTSNAPSPTQTDQHDELSISFPTSQQNLVHAKTPGLGLDEASALWSLEVKALLRPRPGENLTVFPNIANASEDRAHPFDLIYFWQFHRLLTVEAELDVYVHELLTRGLHMILMPREAVELGMQAWGDEFKDGGSWIPQKRHTTIQTLHDGSNFEYSRAASVASPAGHPLVNMIKGRVQDSAKLRPQLAVDLQPIESGYSRMAGLDRPQVRFA